MNKQTKLHCKMQTENIGSLKQVFNYGISLNNLVVTKLGRKQQHIINQTFTSRRRGNRTNTVHTYLESPELVGHGFRPATHPLEVLERLPA